MFLRYLVAILLLFGTHLFLPSCGFAEHLSFDKEVERLLRSPPEFGPISKGLDYWVQVFPNRHLAWLALEAMDEKYEVLNVQDFKMVTSQDSNLKLHRAYHLFDESNPQIFSILTEYVAHYVFRVDPNAEDKLNELRSLSAEKLRLLKRRLLYEIIRDVQRRDERSYLTVESIKDEMRRVLREFPGNSDDHIVRYLEALFLDPSRNQRIHDAEEDVQFEFRFLEEKNSPVVLPVQKAKMIFQMLSTYFVADFSRPYFFYSKLVPWIKTEYGYLYPISVASHQIRAEKFDGLADLRFYISDRDTIMSQVFEQELPIQLVRAGRSLINARQNISGALESLQWFLNEKGKQLSAKSGDRLLRVLNLLLEEGRQKGVLPHNYTVRNTRPSPLLPRNFLMGALSITLEDGQVIKNEGVLGMYGLNRINYGIRRLSFHDRVTLVVEQKSIVNNGSSEDWYSVKLKMPGLFGLEFTQEFNYSDNPLLDLFNKQEENRYISWGEDVVGFDPESVGTRIYGRHVMLSAIGCRLNAHGKRYFQDLGFGPDGS